MATWHRKGHTMRYTFFFGLPTPRRLDMSLGRFARRLNLMHITGSHLVRHAKITRHSRSA